MNQTVETIIYLVVAGLGAALKVIAPFIPAPYDTIIGTVIAVLAALMAALRIVPPATNAQIKETAAKMDRMAARLGNDPRTGPLAVILTACIVGMATQGCTGLTPAQGAAVETAGVDLAVCVLNHIQEPVQQIVTDCGAATAADVIKIIDAHKAAMAREAGK